MQDLRGRVLIVDDDRSVADGLQEILQRYLFYVRVAYSANQAFYELASDAFDVIVVDWILPGGNGRQVIEVSERFFPETAIVVNSAYTTTDTECTASGAHQFVEKGPSTEPVRNAVERGLQFAFARRGQERQAACQAFHEDQWCISAIHEVLDIPTPSSGHLGLASMPRDMPLCLLLWFAGCHSGSSGPVSTVDCQGISSEEIDYTLFGRADVTADRPPVVRRGATEKAWGGTLCVRHVDQLKPATAEMLAEAACTGVVCRTGSDRGLPAHFRLVVTLETTEPYPQAIERLPGQLREVLEDSWVVMPSAPEMKELRPELAQRMLSALSGGRQQIGPSTLQAIGRTGLPSTLVDLKVAIERAHQLGLSSTVEGEDLGIPFLEDQLFQGCGKEKRIKSWNESKSVFARWYFDTLLTETEGNVSRAAKISGLGRQAIYQHMNKFGIDRSHFHDGS
jgi:DNA-binding NtrC family response regulator